MIYRGPGDSAALRNGELETRAGFGVMHCVDLWGGKWMDKAEQCGVFFL